MGKAGREGIPCTGSCGEGVKKSRRVVAASREAGRLMGVMRSRWHPTLNSEVLGALFVSSLHDRGTSAAIDRGVMGIGFLLLECSN